MSAQTDDLPLWVAWFSAAMPMGPALGNPELTTWANFCGVVSGHRRHGPKDGLGFIPSRFELEPDGRYVRRLKANLLARTAIALDIEASKETGELPPTLDEMAKRAEARGYAAATWTSHNHKPPNDIRYRVVLPLSEEIDHELPAVEIIAAELGALGVLDRSKLGAASYFYLPSCSGDDTADLHQEIIVPGAPIDAQWLTGRATALLEAREAEEQRQAAEAHAAAQARLEARLAAGYDPSDSLIEKIRNSLPSLEQILLSHRYEKAKFKASNGRHPFRHPNSKSGSYGADIEIRGGVERAYSLNAGDPLHHEKHALDAFDATVVLDFNGDRNRALWELGERFGFIKRLTKPKERGRLAAHLFEQIRANKTQAQIERSASQLGKSLGLSVSEIIEVFEWVSSRPHVRQAA